MLVGGFDEVRNGRPETKFGLAIAVGASDTVTIEKSMYNDRYSYRSRALKPSETFIYAVTFDSDRAKCIEKNKDMTKNFSIYLKEQTARYDRVRDMIPVLKSKNEGIDNFLSLAPLYHESLKASKPGGVRAKSARFWIWGWDLIVGNYALMAWNDRDFIKSMLDFVEKTADPEGGIFHFLGCNDKAFCYSPIPSQGMYICLLMDYVNQTGDLETLKKHYPFAKTVFEKFFTIESKIPGLFLGTSLFPDFPFCFKENGNDISLFNNSVAYGALRAMEALATLYGDKATAKKARDSFVSAENNFEKFFDEKRGCFVNSIAGDTLEQRDAINTTGLMYDIDYVKDLVDPYMERAGEFLKNNAYAPAGIRSSPIFDTGFDQDANQLHCTWPVVEEFPVYAANRIGYKKAVDDYIRKISYWTGNLVVPEGISYYIETETPELDEWNCESGTWQAYSMRKWYRLVMVYILGLSADTGGLTLAAPAGGAYSLTNYDYHGKAVTVKVSGTGAFVGKLKVNGAEVAGTLKIPSAIIEKQKKIDIEAELSDKRMPLYIESFTGGAVKSCVPTKDGFDLELTGTGTCRLYVHSEKPLTAVFDGETVSRPKGLSVFDRIYEPGKVVRLSLKN
jgi:hypothetical protein